MNKFDAVSIVQFTLLLMTAVGLKNHVIIIPFLLQSSGRDAWITTILAAAIILIWCFLLLYIHKKTEAKNIFDWVEHNIGKIPRIIFSGVVSVYIVFLASGTLRETLVWTEATYLPETSRLFTLPVIILLCFYLANTSLQTMVMTNTIILTAVIILGFFVGFANFQYKDFTLLTPVLEHGFGPIWSGLIFAFSGFIELIICIFMQHKIYDKIRFKHLAVMVVLFAWLTLGPIIGSITEFGPTESAKQMWPAYEQWAIVSIGKFIEHLDFLSIYQWQSGNFIRVSFFLFIALETFRFKSNRNRTCVLVLFCLVVTAFQLVPVNNPAYYFIEKVLFIPMTFWLFLSISIFLGIFVIISSKKPKGQQYVREKE